MIRYSIFFFYRESWSVALIGNDSSRFSTINIDSFFQETYETNYASGEEYSTFFLICLKIPIFSLLYFIISYNKPKTQWKDL
jgi:hypothetical protein